MGALPPTVAFPAAIAFWNTRQGLLGTRSCLTSAGCRAGTISITGDGGRTFEVVLRTRRPVTALQTAAASDARA
jgi:hypothetical protein